jgi:16S rRNA (guanine527-N7)-methyltransferase
VSARISWISLTPVKALALNHVDEIELLEGGLRGDRRFYLIDERNWLVSDKGHGRLQLVRAHHDEERDALTLRLPDDTTVEGEVERGEELETSFHRRAFPARRVPGPWDQALSDVAGEPLRLVDVGSGGGLPGLPLKIAFPALRLTLVESIGKKADFLRTVVEQLRLADVQVANERAERLGHDPQHRDSHDWATARALGTLPVVIELCAPFLVPGGLLVALRRGDLDAEIQTAAPAFKALKLWSRVPLPIDLNGLRDGRGLVVGEKYAPTPDAYPRRPGLANKRPLSA